MIWMTCSNSKSLSEDLKTTKSKTLPERYNIHRSKTVTEDVTCISQLLHATSICNWMLPNPTDHLSAVQHVNQCFCRSVKSEPEHPGHRLAVSGCGNTPSDRIQTPSFYPPSPQTRSNIGRIAELNTCQGYGTSQGSD